MPGVDPTQLALQPINGNGPQAMDRSLEGFTVRFWGVRGNVPTPGLETVRYGGNTACVEVLVGGHRLIFDAGTGLRVLGKHLKKEMPVCAHLFFTHTHWDRIQGFPFFIPAFIPGNTFHIYGAMGQNGASIKQRLCDQMLRPNFPVPLQEMQADLQFHEIRPGSVVTLGDVMIETISLNRPNAALGYRITWQGYSLVYATDIECASGNLDQSLLYLSQGADLLIYDAFYHNHAHDAADKEERPDATWESGIAVASAAKVKRIVMFHHDPHHDDDFLDHIEADVQSRFSHVQLAREGMAITLAKA
ncbi:MBL fold metallo-hydrolase [Leptolyngbya sp. AN02str]|uniref:MBL fold metallo-hydrolase n=1 Tax=Leptolyngbya sp. AN02str TaxID=3423363 RepID=UPI003D31B745